jgi:hypothetical protein
MAQGQAEAHGHGFSCFGAGVTTCHRVRRYGCCVMPVDLSDTMIAPGSSLPTKASAGRGAPGRAPLVIP